MLTEHVDLYFDCHDSDDTSSCARICNLCPLPTKAHSYVLTVERHNTLQTRDIFKESLEHIASR
jgi:hypothetical protein